MYQIKFNRIEKPVMKQDPWMTLHLSQHPSPTYIWFMEEISYFCHYNVHPLKIISLAFSAFRISEAADRGRELLCVLPSHVPGTVMGTWTTVSICVMLTVSCVLCPRCFMYIMHLSLTKTILLDVIFIFQVGTTRSERLSSLVRLSQFINAESRLRTQVWLAEKPIFSIFPQIVINIFWSRNEYINYNFRNISFSGSKTIIKT